MKTRISSSATRRYVPLVPRRIIARHSSTAASHTSPSPKITAVPFRQTPQQAIEKLNTFALISSAQFGNLCAALLRTFFGSLGQILSETLGLGAKLKLRQFKAVYYPIWRTDVIAEGKVWKEGKKSESSNGVIGATGAYVPGNSFAPLSYLSYSVPPLDVDLATYDPAHDLQQLGEGFEIVPIPFTASPLGLEAKIKSTLGSQTTYKDVVFDVQSWKPSFLACYPIMFPIYLADFEYENKHGELRSITTVMDAHDTRAGSCRVSGPPPPEVIERNEAFMKNYWIQPVPFAVSGNVILPSRMMDDHSSDSADEDPDKKPPLFEFKIGEVVDPLGEYSRWMSPPLTSLNSIPPSPMYDVEQTEGGVDWSDARIQSWSGEEREQNEEFFAVGMRYHGSEESVRVIERDIKRAGPKAAKNDKVTRIDLSAEKGFVKSEQTLVDMLKDNKKFRNESRQKWLDSKPEWLKKYEQAQEEAQKKA